MFVKLLLSVGSKKMGIFVEFFRYICDNVFLIFGLVKCVNKIWLYLFIFILFIGFKLGFIFVCINLFNIFCSVVFFILLWIVLNFVSEFIRFRIECFVLSICNFSFL